jgi:hypothetical protein
MIWWEFRKIYINIILKLNISEWKYGRQGIYESSMKELFCPRSDYSYVRKQGHDTVYFNKFFTS